MELKNITNSFVHNCYGQFLYTNKMEDYKFDVYLDTLSNASILKTNKDVITGDECISIVPYKYSYPVFSTYFLFYTSSGNIYFSPS